MSELFKTVLTLSLLGSVLIALLLLLKPVTIKKFPARWQYYIWVTILFSMVIPIYKFIPKQEAKRLSSYITNEATEQTEINLSESTKNSDEPENTVTARQSISKMTDTLYPLWISGTCIYILIAIGSYFLYLLRKHKHSFLIENNSVFEETKKELRIKRKIRLKMSRDIISPMLAGLFFPTVYIPIKNISDENMRMVFLHELTHYKRKDLFVKWFSLFVNAVHWFNPLVYLLCSNISEACEISCDMAVTHRMSDDEQKTYMKTILDLQEANK